MHVLGNTKPEGDLKITETVSGIEVAEVDFENYAIDDNVKVDVR